jgi:hypothetical protein
VPGAGQREYAWTDQGIASATRNGVDLAEAIQALHAPTGLRFERPIGDLLLIVMGMASTGRVIAVLRVHLTRTRIYTILGVRALTGPDLDEWRRRLP